MPELIIGGLALGPIITMFIQALKFYGLPIDKAPLANLILSALAGLLVIAVQSNPEYQTLAVLFLQVLSLFLTAAGTYTTTKWTRERLAA